jgi:hypothetical protein
VKDDDQFDLDLGKADRDAAMDLIEGNTNPDWKIFMLERIKEAARMYAFFTTDHVFDLASQHNAPDVHDLRALGPLMNEAHRLGICQPTDRFELCRRRSRHAAPIRIWQSLLRPAGSP